MDLLAELQRALNANDPARAAELCSQLLDANPDRVDLLTLAATLARQLGRPEAALGFLSRAAELHPSVPELQNNLGVILEDLGRHAEAAKSCRRAIDLRPGYGDAYANLGNSLRSLGDFDEAAASFRQALAIDPACTDALYNLGNLLRFLGRWEEAVESYRTLLSLLPGHLSGWINLGGSLLKLNRFQEAIEAERRALALDPSNADAHWNLSLALLTLGDYRNGWREYEWRLKKPAAGYGLTAAGRPLWDGSPLEGRTLLIRGEQGLGDLLQFFRFVQLLAGRGERVVLECPPQLLSLIASQNPAIACFPAGGNPPPFDCFAYLMSLPDLLGITLENLPAAIPYLAADPERKRAWGERIGKEGAAVGLVWAGSATYLNDRYRSLPLAALSPLAALAGVRLYSLQVGSASQDLATVPWGGRAADLAPELTDFAETAAAVANLDLVVTVDTAVAHLAGALGKQVCLLLPFSGDWRWLDGRNDSPWYPGMRLYRQPTLGDWEPVIASLVRDLVPEPDGLNRLFREANALREAGSLDQAITAYRSLLDLLPGAAEVHNNLGLALQDAKRPGEAEESYRTALRLNPELADACNNLGTILVSRGGYEEAEPFFRRALDLRPGYLPALTNLGACLQVLERPGEAVELYRRAIVLAPEAMEPRINLGTAWQELRQPEAAVAVYREALKREPDNPELHWNLALTLLSLGDFKNGWREYEWRRVTSPSALGPSPAPGEWEAALRPGRTILIDCEQGLGDTLQFVRYVPLVAARGANVLLRCQFPSLKPLLTRVAGVSAVYARGEELPPFDQAIPLLSLPAVFRTTMATVPATPYLSADPDRVAALAGLVAGNAAGKASLKVGLVWRGGPLPRNRACPYPELAMLAGVEGVEFFSLQIGERPDRELLPAADLSGELTDFGATAALVSHFDLVISVDTACAHLAGGMGKPLWLLLPYACDWRWLPASDRSPWYPSMRIFRQEQPGDWKGVLARVRTGLAAATSARVASAGAGGWRMN
ncbi:tetratricopeptide repeat protein [Geomonas sp. Red32]|uniref:tetratricopeptide repeat protein n=1 Tax=Geomonas sp. Red32 TaxID=2912856 RepID=UPI00202CBC82|nr:tetratricopeptide repeat protein [Geomonas sp. Red32]MCM0081174.1 tetratricopeptide repeat protein [Geomonas sp. Red32]